MRRTIRRWRIVTEGLRLVVGHGAYTAKHGEILARRLRPLPRLRGRAGEGEAASSCTLGFPLPSPPSPASAGLSGEDLGIFERQLIDGELGVWLAWVDWRRLADPSDRRSGEQTLPDELGEAQVQHPQGVQTARDAQEQIGDHGGDDLQADGLVGLAHELADVEMLLDPAE